MHVVAIVSQKGGAGKTTLSVHLAVAGARKGMSVALIDLDPQATAAQWGDWRGGDNPAVVATPYTRLEATLQEAAQAGVDVEDVVQAIADFEKLISDSGVTLVNFADNAAQQAVPEEPAEPKETNIDKAVAALLARAAAPAAVSPAPTFSATNPASSAAIVPVISSTTSAAASSNSSQVPEPRM
jgi:molybdopterin-guanine dinucleotide biosynthesis protein